MNKAELQSKHLSELHELAAEAGVERYRMLSRAELIDALADGGGDSSSGRSERSGNRGGSRGGGSRGGSGSRGSGGGRDRQRGGRGRGGQGGRGGREGGRGGDREDRGGRGGGGRDPQRGGRGGGRGGRDDSGGREERGGREDRGGREERGGDRERTPTPSAGGREESSGSEEKPKRRRRRRFGRRRGKTIRPHEMLIPAAGARQALVYAETREACTSLLRELAADLSGGKGPDPVALLVDPSPEELAEWKREAPKAELVSAGQERHAEDALAQAVRRAESGEAVVFLIDSLTRFAEEFGGSKEAKELFDGGLSAGGSGSLTVIAAIERPAE